ncbi:MAG TPA: mannose-6-phosphate isomerase, class I [Chitinophagaceae bacterium]
MTDKNNASRLSGKIQHYQWGGYSYIPHLLGIGNEGQKPFAEYWLGAHDNAPSVLENGQGLNEFIRQHPSVLGDKVQQQFGRLPYLLKILDVKDMLSIQVHPDKRSATRSFAAENAAGIPLTAPHRNYKDDNHKPELMVALSGFWLLHGFRNPESLKETLRMVPEFSFLLHVFKQEGYKALYESLMTMEQEKVNSTLQPLLDRLMPAYQNGKLSKSDPGFWAARAALTYNEPGKVDRGIFSIYLLNLVHLQKGDAVFQDAGILHAYLEGQNVEIMANSDNVLRGGLTPKHVDVPELLKYVSFQPVDPQIIQGKPINTTESVYKTPAPDFELSRLLLQPGLPYSTTVRSTDIFLVLNGTAEINSGGVVQVLKQGEALVAFNSTALIFRSDAGAEIYHAGVPQN